MNRPNLQRSLYWLARLVALGLGVVLAFASVRFWNETLLVGKLHGLLTLVALLVFALLPRTVRARAIVRPMVLILGGAALLANVFSAAYSAGRLEMVGPWPVVLQLAIVVLSAVMIFEVSDYMARIVTLRDFLLLVAAVVVGLLLYDYISARTAFLTDVLVKQWNLQTYVQQRIADAVPFCLAAMAVGALLVLMTARLAEEPHRLALYLSFALPLVYLIIMVSSLTFLHSLRESILSTFRIFAVVGVAFAAGCLLGGRLFQPKHSNPQ